MAYVSIPLSVLESQEYLSMTPAGQKFLIDLYALFHDCETFTIDMEKPTYYRQPAGSFLNKKVSNLLDSGLIEVVGSVKRKFTYQRVFAFTHPAFQLERAA